MWSANLSILRTCCGQQVQAGRLYSPRQHMYLLTAPSCDGVTASLLWSHGSFLLTHPLCSFFSLLGALMTTEQGGTWGCGIPGAEGVLLVVGAAPLRPPRVPAGVLLWLVQGWLWYVMRGPHSTKNC